MWLRGHRSKIINYGVFIKGLVFILANSADPDEMAT